MRVCSVLCILEKESKTKTTFSLIGCIMNYKYCILTASSRSRALQPKGTWDHVTCLKPRKNDMLCHLCQNRAAWWRLIKRLYYHSSLTFEYYKWQELSHTLQSSPSTNSVKQNLPLQLSCLTGEMYLNDQLAYVTLLQHYTLLMNGPHIWISTSGSYWISK